MYSSQEKVDACLHLLDRTDSVLMHQRGKHYVMILEVLLAQGMELYRQRWQAQNLTTHMYTCTSHTKKISSIPP